MPGTRRNMPGVPIGTTWPVANIPALPRDAPSPGPLRSITTTSWPSRCNASAEQIPTMPAPTITQRIEGSPRRPNLSQAEPGIDGVRQPEAELGDGRDDQQACEQRNEEGPGGA